MTLKIVTLEIDNFKRIKAGFKLSPTSDLVIVQGQNKQGKTSVLDAIWAALAGGDAGKEVTLPITAGETRASVVLKLADEDGVVQYTITRKWTAAGTTLTVTDLNGKKLGTPQRVLDKLIGERSFDPNAFTRLKAKEQVTVLLGTVELPFKPDELAAERAAIYEQRTTVGRDVSRLDGVLASLPDDAVDVPDDFISVTDLLTTLDGIRNHNRDVEARRQAANDSWRKQKALEAQIMDLQTEHDALIAATAELVTVAKAVEAQDEQVILHQMDTADATNEAVRQKQYRTGVLLDRAHRKSEQDGLTGKLAAIDKRKADALAAVTFPVEGLSFDESGVLYNGLPFSQASGAEQWRVSSALSMAANPELRVLRILDGSLLDDNSLAVLEELTGEKDYQVWIEMVGERSTDDSMSITIFDGEIVE